jgi:predicted dehydrogenase
LEQIKLKLIQSGIFGRVHSSFSDFAGHGYHGMSVMRSYLGFDSRPVRVSGSLHEYPLAPHWSRLGGPDSTNKETQEHALVEFEGGQVGVFHWTSIAYDSPMRWWRSSRFLAEKGMGITTGVGLDVTEQLSVLAAGGQAPHFITVERRWERVDGGALESIVAHTGLADLSVVTWENPLRPRLKGRGPQWHDDEIGVAGCLLSLVKAVRSEEEPSYGTLQARLDQELVLALRLSAQQGGKPVHLPLDNSSQA